MHQFMVQNSPRKPFPIVLVVWWKCGFRVHSNELQVIYLFWISAGSLCGFFCGASLPGALAWCLASLADAAGTAGVWVLAYPFAQSLISEPDGTNNMYESYHQHTHHTLQHRFPFSKWCQVSRFEIVFGAQAPKVPGAKHVSDP